MNVGKTLYVKTRKEWRAWLAKHYKTATEIWLIYYKKESGKPRIPYNDAVDEALCYGWIDSLLKPIDKMKYAQRYSPRKKTSRLSDNESRARARSEQGGAHDQGRPGRDRAHRQGHGEAAGRYPRSVEARSDD